MNESFSPSLLISLGSAAGKSLKTARKFLACLPKHFSDLIEFYEVENLEVFPEEIQKIVDTKLLAARYLNTLVDMGYKIRNQNLSSVRINIYFFYDAYDCSISASEAISKLMSLTFGTSNHNRHSGVALYIFSVLEKEWAVEEKESAEAVKRLKQVVEFISREESMLSFDSKLLVLSCINSDGTRIPKEELEDAAAFLAYLNVLPSSEPLFSNFNRRLLMHEVNYKLGTAGISGITVYKDKLISNLALSLAGRMVKHACEYEVGAENYSHNPAMLAVCKNEFNSDEIDKELGRIISSCSLKEGLNCLNTVRSELVKIIQSSEDSTQESREKPENQITTKQSGNNGKKSFRFIDWFKSITNLIFSRKYLNSDNVKEDRESYEEKDQEAGALLKNRNCESLKETLLYVDKKIDFVKSFMKDLKGVLDGFKPDNSEIEMDNIFTELVAVEEVNRLYKEKLPSVDKMYSRLIEKTGGYEEIRKMLNPVVLFELSKETILESINPDLYELSELKFKDRSPGEVVHWLDKGLVKSGYFLQNMVEEGLEEHAILVTSKKIRELLVNNQADILKKLKLSVIDDRDIVLGYITLVRLCLGINLDDVTLRKKERINENYEQNSKGKL